MNKTNIEWTTFSANPLKYRRKSDGKVVWACVKTSPGCAHCYSEAIALRFERGRLFNAKNMEEVEPFLDEAELHKMRTAKTIGGVPVSGSRCFLGDMTDIFGEWIPDDLLNRLFTNFLENRCDVTWQLLTKRAQRMRDYLSWRWGEGRIPCRHIHCGVSVEDQARADERREFLKATPAVIKFASYEPALGPVDWTGWEFLDWLIIGGESGPGARPFNVAWARQSIAWCKANDVRPFLKQLGSHPIQGGDLAQKTGCMEGVKLRDKKGGDITEWEEDLRIREFLR